MTKRCQMCNEPIRGTTYRVEATPVGPPSETPPKSWDVCHDCYQLVAQDAEEIEELSHGYARGEP